MTNHRRAFLKKILVLLGSTLTTSVRADNFVPNILDETAKPAAKNTEIIDTDKIEIKLAKIAEKGVAVPITVTSSLENIQTIAILVEKNPVPLVAKFRLSAELDAFVTARLEMTESSDVVVLVETSEGVYRAREQVKVTIGGCGI